MYKTIAVIGSASSSSKTLKAAEELGREIALRGFALICGGLGGVMEAACRGAASVDNHPPIIGILPGKKAADANQYVDISIPTGLGLARNAVIACAADGVIAVEGGSGTLSEIAFSWQFGKPVAALTSTGGFAAELSGRSLDKRRNDKIMSAATPAEAVELIAKAIGGEKSPSLF